MTGSGLTYLEVSSEVCHDSFCQLGNSVSLSWAVCREAFCLHVISSSSCIPVLCLEPVLFLIPLQCVNLFCNLSKCVIYGELNASVTVLCGLVGSLSQGFVSGILNQLVKINFYVLSKEQSRAKSESHL